MSAVNGAVWLLFVAAVVLTTLTLLLPEEDQR